MALNDKKKVQTMVNVAAEQIQIIRSAINTLKTVRTAFQTHNPDVTGTVLEGNVSTLNSSLNSLDTESLSGVWDTLINGVVESHRNKALE